MQSVIDRFVGKRGLRILVTDKDVFLFSVGFIKHSMMQKITLEEFHYNSDGSVCDQKEYERRCLVVRSLINNGFSNVLVRFLKPLISNGYSYSMIRELFNENSETEEVRDFIEQVKLA